MIVHEGSRVSVRFRDRDQLLAALQVFANWWSWKGSSLSSWEVFLIAYECARRP